MKKLLYITVIILFGSCTALKSVKKQKTSTSTSVRSEVARYDSIVKVERNKAIFDKMVFTIPKSNTANKQNDSILDARLDEILATINFQKKSGSNGYKIKYNPKRREIETNITVGATEDKNRQINTEKEDSITETSTINSFVKKTGIPLMWLISGVVFLLRKEIYWLIKKGLSLLKIIV